MNYAYARVSSKDQRLERQFAAFEECGIAFDHIYYDKKSGADFERRNYQKLVKRLKPGDLLVIKSIDRLGRNYDCILKEWKLITKDIGADIYVLDMPLLDTRSREHNLIGKLIGDIVLQLLSFVAENERENIRTRQAEGIAIAKQKGVRFGRPPVAMPDNFHAVADDLKNRKITMKEALSLTGLTLSTFYRIKKRS